MNLNWWEQLLVSIVMADPNVSPAIKAALQAAVIIAGQKKNGWITFAPDDGTPAVQLAHVQF